MATASDWFVVIKGREQGPFTPDGMRTLVADGSITADTLVRRGDQTAAVRAAQIRGLLPAAAGPSAATATVAAPGGTRSGTSTAIQTATAKTSARAPAAAQDATARTPAPALQRHGGTRRHAPARAEEPDAPAAEDSAEGPAAGEAVSEGRATPAQRLRSLGIDVLLIGGVSLGLICYAWGMADRATAKRIAEIDAVRQTQSEAQVANRGEPRPSMAGWPALKTELEARIAAKRQVVEAAQAALPKIPKGTAPTQEQALQEAAATNLANELEFLVKYREFEASAHARESAQIAVLREAASRSANFLLGMGVFLLLVVAPVCELLTGGTPGKLLTGLRAVGPGRRAIGAAASLIRHAARFVPGVHVTLFTAGDGLALHDRWSQSEVVLKAAVQRGGRKAVAVRDQGRSRSAVPVRGVQTVRAARSR